MKGDLSEYQRKRDFDRTSEPAGQQRRRGRARSLRFVIQKHAASHLHYDLRLELDGVMKSWAVPKGPSLDPSVRRLAMQVEDHPIEYNTFEGTIPKGEYGGGTVMLWDRGTYTPDEPSSGEADADAVRRGLRAGKLSFSFHGERLHGSFALVRTRSSNARGDKPQWLLIKHRDDTAAAGSDITTDILTSVDSGRTMAEIAADADRTWRSNRRTRSAAGKHPAGDAAGAKESEHSFTPMKPYPSRTVPDPDGWTFEPWRGGDRVIAYVTSGDAHLIGESGQAMSRRFPEIVTELTQLAGRVEESFVVEGEIADDDGASAFFFTDILLQGDRVLAPEPWQERRDALGALLHRRRLRSLRRPEWEVHPERAARVAARHRWPGLLARRDDAPYSPGERSDALLRITN